MSDSSVDKAQKTKDIEHRSGKKQNHEQALQEAKTELEKEWLADLNAALGDNLEAHLHDPKGPSLPISIHFASKAPTAGP